MSDSRAHLALQLFQEAYEHQMHGDLDLAASLYKNSIELYPTAEAYTYLGWTYRYQGKIDEAIDECKNAILIDPTFGNPYNDIGAYLIDKGLYDEAIPWLEKALDSKRYESFHFPWYNLGRVYAEKEMYNKARDCFRKALALEPKYTIAQEGFDAVTRLLQ
jgi:tetratricopeptide (TPR) repeat protein